MKAPLQVLALVGFPGVALLAARHVKPVAWLGPVVLCYAFGILLGNAPGVHPAVGLSLSVSEVAVPLALPLLLFSSDVRRWLRLARSTLVSFGLACASAMVGAALVGLVCQGGSDEWWKISGMLVGVYTGGTANLNAVGLALGVREETLILVNTADIVVSSVYLLLIITVAQRAALLFLPPFTRTAGGPPDTWDEAPEPERSMSVSVSVPLARRARDLAGALGLAALLVGVSVGASHLVLGAVEGPFVMLLLTTLSLAASLVPAVRGLVGSYEAGDYALLVFCVAVGTLADASRLGEGGPFVFAFCAGVVTVTVALHFALAALWRIDADTALITSVSTILGPPFIGLVARALRNRELVVSGLTTGLMGYAVGTYLGLAVAWMLRP